MFDEHVHLLFSHQYCFILLLYNIHSFVLDNKIILYTYYPYVSAVCLSAIDWHPYNLTKNNELLHDYQYCLFNHLIYYQNDVKLFLK